MSQQGFKMSDEEKKTCEEHGKNLAGKLLASTVAHPLTFAKTLIQLGHEPYALVKDKKWIFFGEFVYFQPNVFKYLLNTYRSHGLAIFYTGVGANALLTITGDLGCFFTSLYMDKVYPEIGGQLEGLDKMAETELDNHQLLRVKVRRAIRDSIAHTIGTVAARPFCVIMVRQIAQHISNENKYRNVLQALLRIGNEEGPSGFFSGLIPQIVGGIIYVWGVATVSYGVEQSIRFLENNQDPHDDETKSIMNNMRTMCNLVTPFLVNGWRYPLEVVSTVLAVAGSGLAVSMLPYTPMFPHWQDAYDYMKPHEIKRGRSVFLRQELGPIAVRDDGKLYANKKHFI